MMTNPSERELRRTVESLDESTNSDTGRRIIIEQTVNNDRVNILKSEEFHKPPESPDLTNNWRIQQCDDDTDDDVTASDVCCSWKADCDHDEHDIVIDFTAIDT